MCAPTTLVVRVVYHGTLSGTRRRMTLSLQRGYSIAKIGMAPVIEIGLRIGEAVAMIPARENGTAIAKLKIWNQHPSRKGITTWMEF